jgi:hypothetical protein
MTRTCVGSVLAVTAATFLLAATAARASHLIFVGVGYDPAIQSNQVVSINGTSGAATVLNTFTFSGGGYFGGLTPGKSDNFYALSSNDTLYDFNATTGQIISDVPLTYPVESYISTPSGFVGVGYDASTQQNQVVAFNATTGAATVLNSFQFDSGFYNGEMVAGPDSNFYMLSSAGTLYDFADKTGQIISETPLSYAFQTIVETPSGLVGIGYDASAQQNQILSINTTSGATTVLNSFNFDSGGYYGEFAPGAGDDFYTLSSAPTIYDFNAASGQIISATPVDYPLQAFTTVSVPEPGTYALMTLGFGLLGLILRRMRGLRGLVVGASTHADAF